MNGIDCKVDVSSLQAGFAMMDSSRGGAMSTMPLNRCIRIPAVLMAMGILCACSAVPLHEPSAFPPLARHEIPRFPAENLLEVTDEMAAFVAEHAPPTLSKEKRSWALAYAAVDPYLMGFKYNPSLTLPPAEAFRRRTGNCMSFSLMLVAMARHAGIDARFEAAVLPPDWSSSNDIFLNSQHINVLLGREHNTYLVDVSGNVFGRELTTRRLSDREAEAQYYNNLGVDALLENDRATAWARFRQAINTDPRAAYLWSNLGVVYNRNQQPRDAEWAYHRALSVNRWESIAINNLYVMYQQQGRIREAAEIEDEVERHRRRNPYYLAMLADDAVASEQYDDAIALLRRSIKINEDEYRFHGALAQAQYLAGRYEEAQSSLDTARSLAPPAVAAELQQLPLQDIWE